MLNSETIYFDCGRKVAEARRQCDEGRAQFQSQWFNRAKRLETTADRQLAESAFANGYRSVSQPVGLSSQR
jgi:hypothetical protein